MTSIKCPCCKGKGKIEAPTKRTKYELSEIKTSAAKALIEAGFSFRQAAEVLGYKSVNSITHVVKGIANKKQPK